MNEIFVEAHRVNDGHQQRIKFLEECNATQRATIVKLQTLLLAIQQLAMQKE